MRHFPLTDQLKTILGSPECPEWILSNVEHGAAPAFVDGQLCFRLEDDAEAKRLGSGGCSFYFRNLALIVSLTLAASDREPSLAALRWRAIWRE